MQDLYAERMQLFDRLMDELQALRNSGSQYAENEAEYRKALRIDEQNCFSEHFRGIAVIILYNDLGKFFGEDEDLSFYVDFYADALVCAIKRWLVDKDCMPASKFVRLIKRCLMGISDEVAEGHTSALVR